MHLEKHELLFAGAMILGWGIFASASPNELSISPLLAVGFFMIAIGNLGYGYQNYKNKSSTPISNLSNIGFGIGMTIMGAAGLSLLPIAASFYTALILFGVGIIGMIYTQATSKHER